MHFTELALQGVRGFSPATRVAFRPGYWVLKPPAGPIAPPLTTVCAELCFPSGADRTLLAPTAKSGKAGLLLESTDKQMYRLIRDLGGGGALHRLNAEKQVYELVTADPIEIPQFMRSHAGMPDRGTFEWLFCFKQQQLPSRRPAEAPKSSSSGATSAWATMLEDKPTIDPALRLRDLERELQLSQEVEQLQFRADGLTTETFQLHAVLQSTEGLEGQLNELRAAYEQSPTPEKFGLPADIVQQAQKLPNMESKFKDALAKLDVERQMGQSSFSAKIPPLTKDLWFWMGIGVGIISLLAGGFGPGLMHYLAALDVPAFGLAAFQAWRFIDDKQFAERFVRKEERILEREKKIQAQYEAEIGPIVAAMKTVNVETPKELSDAFAQHVGIQEKMREIEGQIEATRSQPEYAAASHRIEQIVAEQEGLQSEIAKKGAYVRPMHDIQRDLEKVKAAMATGQKSVTAVNIASKISDPCPALFSQAANLFGSDIPSLVALMQDRCKQYFSALTDKRWQGIEFNPEGAAIVLGQAGKVPLGLLPPRDVDFAYLSLRLTVLEKYCQRFKVPVLIEGFLETVDETKTTLLARMLKHLGTLTQVLHVTSHEPFTAAATGSVNV